MSFILHFHLSVNSNQNARLRILRILRILALHEVFYDKNTQCTISIYFQFWDFFGSSFQPFEKPGESRLDLTGGSPLVNSWIII